MVTLSFYSKLVQDFEEEKNRVFGTKNVKGSVDNPILFITDHNPTFGEKKTLLAMLPLVKNISKLPSLIILFYIENLGL